MKKIKKLIKKQGFTLVELIIVIAIIAVLAVAAFMMLTKWLGKSRDSRRLGDLGTIARGLQVGYSDIDDGINMYPSIMHQDDKIGLMSGDEVVGYQGRVDSEVVKGASMQKVPLDPSDNNEYTYLVTQNRQKFQVLGMLEDGTEVGVLNDVYALEYTNRVPTTKGFELGVLLHKDTNLPIQYAGVGFTGIDLTSEGERDNYKAIVSDNRIETGTGVALVPIVKEETIEVSQNEQSEETQSSYETVLLLHGDLNYEVNDDFSGTDGSEPNATRWTNYSSYFNNIQGNKLKFQIPNTESGAKYSGINSNYYLRGDFSIEVDFSGVDAKSAAGAGLELLVFDNLLTSDISYLKVGYDDSAGDIFVFSAKVNGVRSAGTTTRDNNYGKIKLVRNGSTLEYYYVDGNGSFSDAPNFTRTTVIGEVGIRLGYRVPNDLGQTGTFDNFKINYANIVGHDFVDEKGNTVTKVGDVVHVVDAGKVGDAIKFEGNDYLSIADSDDWNFGTGDFTIDFWAKFDALDGTRVIVSQHQDINNRWAIGRIGADNTIRIFNRAASVNTHRYDFPWTPSLDTWYYVVFKREGDDITCFVDGEQIGDTVTDTDPFGDFNGNLYIGDTTIDLGFSGYLDDFRIIK